jgi:Flp pilus assembly protein TadD
LRWREGGAILWQAAMLLHQGREDEANRRAEEAFALFPDELRIAINGK